jgi:hypothetical protein
MPHSTRSAVLSPVGVGLLPALRNAGVNIIGSWRAAIRGARSARALPSGRRCAVIGNERLGEPRKNGGGRGIRTPKGLAARWISSPLPYQLRLALRVRSDRYLRYTKGSRGIRNPARVELLPNFRPTGLDEALHGFGEPGGG